MNNNRDVVVEIRRVCKTPACFCTGQCRRGISVDEKIKALEYELSLQKKFRETLEGAEHEQS